MEKTTACPYTEESSPAASYLAGELTTRAADAFEQHYFSCETCWGDVRTMSELRSALGRPTVVLPRREPSHSTWSLLAAAAVLAFAAVGLWQLAHKPAAEQVPVLRGSTIDALVLRAGLLANDRIELSWSSHEEAQTYRVQVLRSDGVPVWIRNTSRTSIQLDPPLTANPSGSRLSATVEAIDAMGQVVAKSSPVSLPVRSRVD